MSAKHVFLIENSLEVRWKGENKDLDPRIFFLVLFLQLAPFVDPSKPQWSMCREPMSQPDAGDNSNNKKCFIIFIIADDNFTCVYTSGTDTVSYPMRAPNRRRISDSSIRSVWTMWSDVMRPSFRARLMMFVAQTKGIQYLLRFPLSFRSNYKIIYLKIMNSTWLYLILRSKKSILLDQRSFRNKLNVIKVKNSIFGFFTLTSTSDFFDP